MSLEFGLTDELCNTQYAPLAVLLAAYQRRNLLSPLESVRFQIKTREFTPYDKLQQLLVSILAGCETLVEVNSKLGHEQALAQVLQWPRFADQSTLSRLLDDLTLTQIEQLEHAARAIWAEIGRTPRHDWRGYLWLDFDLSGLPCAKDAQKSQYGYFSAKKSSVDGN